MNSPADPALSPIPAWRAILVAGLVAGALDIGYVFVYFHTADPLGVLRGIAAGLLGPGARQGGVGTAALGLALHFGIALGAAAFFYAASRVLPSLRRRPLLWGPLYGVAVWEFMNLAVLPLSANPPKSLLAGAWQPVLVAHLFCVGLPIALIVRRLSPPVAAT